MTVRVLITGTAMRSAVYSRSKGVRPNVNLHHCREDERTRE